MAVSPLVEDALRPQWFWAEEDRELSRQRKARLEKLFGAYVAETKLRDRLGKPPLTEPPIPVERARAALYEANAPLRAAKRRPKQIGDLFRLGGAGVCLLGLVTLLLLERATRQANAASPSADGAAR